MKEKKASLEQPAPGHQSSIQRQTSESKDRVSTELCSSDDSDVSVGTAGSCNQSSCTRIGRSPRNVMVSAEIADFLL